MGDELKWLAAPSSAATMRGDRLGDGRVLGRRQRHLPFRQRPQPAARERTVTVNQQGIGAVIDGGPATSGAGTGNGRACGCHARSAATPVKATNARRPSGRWIDAAAMWLSLLRSSGIGRVEHGDQRHQQPLLQQGRHHIGEARAAAAVRAPLVQGRRHGRRRRPVVIDEGLRRDLLAVETSVRSRRFGSVAGIAHGAPPRTCSPAADSA